MSSQWRRLAQPMAVISVLGLMVLVGAGRHMWEMPARETHQAMAPLLRADRPPPSARSRRHIGVSPPERRATPPPGVRLDPAPIDDAKNDPRPATPLLGSVSPQHPDVVAPLRWTSHAAAPLAAAWAPGVRVPSAQQEPAVEPGVKAAGSSGTGVAVARDDSGGGVNNAAQGLRDPDPDPDAEQLPGVVPVDVDALPRRRAAAECPAEVWRKVEAMFDRRRRTRSDMNQFMEPLRDLALKVDHVTEVGVRACVSCWAFATAKPAVFLQVDTQRLPGVDDLGALLERCSPTGNGARGGGDDDDAAGRGGGATGGMRWEFFRESSLTHAFEETDLLFLDTWHSYEQLHKELARTAHLVRRYIVMHDTESFEGKDEVDAGCDYRTGRAASPKCTPEFNQPDSPHGLWPAVQAFLESHPDEWALKRRYTESSGLTVLKRVGAPRDMAVTMEAKNNG